MKLYYLSLCLDQIWSHLNSILVIREFGFLAGLSVFFVSDLVFLVVKVDISGVLQLYGIQSCLQSAMILVANLGFCGKWCLDCFLSFDLPVNFICVTSNKPALVFYAWYNYFSILIPCLPLCIKYLLGWHANSTFYLHDYWICRNIWWMKWNQCHYHCVEKWPPWWYDEKTLTGYYSTYNG